MSDEHEHDRERITELFRQIGEADDYAERIARSQENGEPAVARALFLRLAKYSCIWSNDLDMISAAEKVHTTDSRQKAINKLLLEGVAKQDLLDIIRYTQFETLAVLFYLMDDSDMVQDILPDDVDVEELGISWGLCQLDEDGELISPISSLHESISPDEL